MAYLDFKPCSEVSAQRRVVITESVHTLDDLFRAFVDELEFPYFGSSWDSLSKLLDDLEWLNGETVAIVHEGLPGLPDKQLRAYVQMLLCVASDWGDDKRTGVTIVFSPHLRERVIELAPPGSLF